MAGQREAKRSVCRSAYAKATADLSALLTRRSFSEGGPPMNTENRNKVRRQNGVTELTPLSWVAGTPSAPLRADRP